MEAIIISDTAFIGKNLEEIKNSANALKELFGGTKVILLSNRPKVNSSYREIYEFDDEDLGYKSLKLIDTGFGSRIFIANDDIFDAISLYYFYGIYGNGALVYDSNKNLIIEDQYISNDDLDEIVKVLKENGYKPFNATSGDIRFNETNNLYRLLSKNMENSDVFGIQCSKNDTKENEEIIKVIEKKVPSIVGYDEDGKISFYQRKVNKLSALKKLAEYDNIDLENSLLLLDNATDDILARELGAANLLASNENGYQYGSVNKALRRLI